MEFTNIDTGPMAALLGTLTLLIVVDTVLGAISAAAGGSFSLEKLYAVCLTKGAVLFRVAILMGAGAITPFFDFSLFGFETDPFSVLGMGLAAPLALSTMASIADNVGKKDTTEPQGINPTT